MTRAPDLCWEALVEATEAVPELERGALNTALSAIRACAHREGIHPDSIPDEIRIRARAYRDVMPACTLTPMALAKHWLRVVSPHRAPAPLTHNQATMNALRHQQHGDVQL